jgi:hypothetical protein
LIFFGTIGTATALSLPLLALLVVPIAEIVRSAFRHWVTVTDLIERSVFEATYALSNRMVLTNHDALQHGDWQEVYGVSAPREEDLVSALSTIPADQVRRSVAALVEKNILTRTADGHIAIVW